MAALQRISESTWLPLGLVVSMIGVVIAGTVAFASVSFQSHSNTHAIEVIQEDRKRATEIYLAHLISIETQLGEIKTSITFLKESQERNHR